MRSCLLFALLYLFVAAWAGGYQGCLERVWLYQAYLIDSLNDYNDQTIGWQCKDKGITKNTKTCSNWVRMVCRICMHILPDQTDLFGLTKISQEARVVRRCPTTSSYLLWVVWETVLDGL